MSTYQQIIYHIIFRTRKNDRSLNYANHKELFCFFRTSLSNKKCNLYNINGMDDHVHLIISLHPTIALAHLMRDIKTTSSLWLKQNKNFEYFKGWADGYTALTYSNKEKEALINYIDKEQERHKAISFKQELKQLLVDNGVVLEQDYYF